MQQSNELSHGQRGPLSSAKFSEVGRCNRVYDSRCSHCFVLQELFDNFDYHSRVDILNKIEKMNENGSHLEMIVRYFERNCGWLFESFLSCFAVQVSITLLQLTYSWSQQVLLVLNDLFVGEMSVERLKRTEYSGGNLEVVWIKIRWKRFHLDSRHGVHTTSVEWTISTNTRDQDFMNLLLLLTLEKRLQRSIAIFM